MVYYWPSLVNITQGGGKLAKDVMLFSMSKLTGHAGSRLGWALVKDPQFAADMDSFMRAVSLHVSIDSQHRSAVLLQTLAVQLKRTKEKHRKGGANVDMFSWVNAKMTQRWDQATAALAGSPRFSNHAVPGTFYLWLHCDQARDLDCAATFKNAGVIGETGTLFGVGADFVRLEMVLADANFETMVNRLAALAKQ